MNSSKSLSRRHLLVGLAATSAASALDNLALAAPQPAPAPAGNRRIRQSIVYWCFNSAGERWNMERTCQVARELGCVSVELAAPEEWPTIRKHGLTCAIASNGMPGAPF